MWGAFFTETWYRKNNRISFKWNVVDYKNKEQRLTEYNQKFEGLKTSKDNGLDFELDVLNFEHENTYKTIGSYIYLIILVKILNIDVQLIKIN